MAASLTPSQFAEALGPGIATDRQIRNLCAEGMAGATRDSRGRWSIDPDVAKAWISDPANASRISGRFPLEAPISGATSSPAPTITAATRSLDAGLSSVLERHIGDMDKVAGVLLTLIAGGKFDPRAATMLKQTLSEIRLAETHALQMRHADARFIERERHRRIVATLATIFRHDLEAMIARWPDVMLSKLTEQRIAISDPAEALRALRAACEEEVYRQLTRLADGIERMDLESGAQS